MTQTPDDWSDLTRAWTDPATDDPETARAQAALIRSLHRRDRLARLNFAAEILGGVIVTAVIVWTAVRTSLPWPVIVAALGFVAFGLAVTLWSRRGDPGVMTQTPRAVLQSAVAQARMGERWGLAGIGISFAAFGFLGVVAHLDLNRDDLPWFYPTFIVFLIGCVLGYGLHALRCRRRRRAHEAALLALAEDADTSEP